MTKLKDIATIITQLKTSQHIEDFLKEILTPNEVNEVIKRWDIFTMLSQGISQREIAAKLRTSLCAVTRGSKELQKNKSTIRDILKKHGH